MHPKVLSANAWKTARSLASGGWLDSWVLAGGTSLALHLGHRYSEDLELFGNEPFDPAGLAQTLSKVGPVRVQQSGGTLAGVFAMLDRRYQAVDFNTYHLLKSLVYFEDAEEEPMPRMIKSAEWDAVKKSMIAEVRRLS